MNKGTEGAFFPCYKDFPPHLDPDQYRGYSVVFNNGEVDKGALPIRIWWDVGEYIPDDPYQAYGIIIWNEEA